MLTDRKLLAFASKE